MTLRSIRTGLLMSLIAASQASAAEILLGINTKPSSSFTSQDTYSQETSLRRLNERHFQEIAARQVEQMASLEHLALVGLAIAPTLNTLSSNPVDGLEVVSYNQWLGSSFVSGPSAAPMQVTGLSLRLNAAVRNRNTFIGITESVNQRPDTERLIARMDTSVLSTMELNTTIQVDLLPEADSEPGILLPDREYWVVFGVDGIDHSEELTTGLYHWSYTRSTGPFETAPHWSIGSRTATGNTLGQNWSTIAQSPQSFSVTLSPIPEPSQSILFITAFATIALQRRRSS